MHALYFLSQLAPMRQLLSCHSNPQIQNNTLACGSGIIWNPRFTKQLNNLCVATNYY